MSGKAVPVLEVEGLRRVFARKGKADLVAVRDVSFSLAAGECLGIVGESGSGKSTVANLILRLTGATAGRILLDGRDITQARGAELRRVYRSIQAVFQDPAGSFDPRQTLGTGAAEGLRNAGIRADEAASRVAELFSLCGLDPALMSRFPREVSGGQCQRAAIARALALRPRVLVCDEATSALDVTVQRQIADLLARLGDELGMARLFICHDIALVQGICDRVLVMHEGAVVEQGPCEQVLGDPQDAYTRRLIDAVL